MGTLIVPRRLKAKDAIGIPDVLDMDALHAEAARRDAGGDVSAAAASAVGGDWRGGGTRALYELTTVVHHKGATAHAGHYVVDVWDPYRGGWWNLDDESAALVVAAPHPDDNTWGVRPASGRGRGRGRDTRGGRGGGRAGGGGGAAGAGGGAAEPIVIPDEEDAGAKFVIVDGAAAPVAGAAGTTESAGGADTEDAELASALAESEREVQRVGAPRSAGAGRSEEDAEIAEAKRRSLAESSHASSESEASWAGEPVVAAGGRKRGNACVSDGGGAASKRTRGGGGGRGARRWVPRPEEPDTRADEELAMRLYAEETGFSVGADVKSVRRAQTLGLGASAVAEVVSPRRGGGGSAKRPGSAINDARAAAAPAEAAPGAAPGGHCADRVGIDVSAAARQGAVDDDLPPMPAPKKARACDLVRPVASGAAPAASVATHAAAPAAARGAGAPSAAVQAGTGMAAASGSGVVGARAPGGAAAGAAPAATAAAPGRSHPHFGAGQGSRSAYMLVYRLLDPRRAAKYDADVKAAAIVARDVAAAAAIAAAPVKGAAGGSKAKLTPPLLPPPETNAAIPGLGAWMMGHVQLCNARRAEEGKRFAEQRKSCECVCARVLLRAPPFATSVTGVGWQGQNSGSEEIVRGIVEAVWCAIGRRRRARRPGWEAHVLLAAARLAAAVGYGRAGPASGCRRCHRGW